MSDSNDLNGKCVIIFSAEATRQCSEQRLPPTYVGVRRVRPSSRMVQSALRSSSSSIKSPVVFKVIDETTGEERRMTTEEKKDLKRKLATERSSGMKLEKDRLPNESSEYREAKEPSLESSSSNGYLQFEVNQSALSEELADIRGDRHGVPPVALAPSLARLAFLQGTLLGGPSLRYLDVVVDDDMAATWAVQLKESMKPAEKTRASEDLREMPYTLRPEVWQRMRPVLGSTKGRAPSFEPLSGPNKESRTWALSPLGPHSTGDRSTTRFNHTDAITELLHRDTGLYLGCGAKFGCDFLIYNGPREENHSFAGLRVVISSDPPRLPLPSAYDMSAYVRGLNTAGKIALLASVVEGNPCRVAFVDLALHKVATTKSRREAGTGGT